MAGFVEDSGGGRMSTFAGEQNACRPANDERLRHWRDRAIPLVNTMSMVRRGLQASRRHQQNWGNAQFHTRAFLKQNTRT
jgi:hypothetical protein